MSTALLNTDTIVDSTQTNKHDYLRRQRSDTIDKGYRSSAPSSRQNIVGWETISRLPSGKLWAVEAGNHKLVSVLIRPSEHKPQNNVGQAPLSQVA